MRRFRIVVMCVVVVTSLAAVGTPPAAARRGGSFCQYVKKHTFEFTQVFAPGTSPQTDAAASEQEVRRLAKRAPGELKAPFKTYLKLLKAIRVGDFETVGALASDAVPAVQAILGYVATRCGVKLPTAETPPTG